MGTIKTWAGRFQVSGRAPRRPREGLLGRAGRLALALGVTGALGATAASCSLIVDTEADQCKKDEECKNFPGRVCADGVCVIENPCSTTADCASIPGTICKSGACIPSEEPECTTAGDCDDPTKTCEDGKCVDIGGECMVNADCASQGTHFICRKDTKTCVNLTSALCTVVEGKYQDDNAVIIGSILPTIGANDDAGLAMEKGAQLAIGEFDQIANGLPPVPGSTARRPLVMVGCTDESNSDKGVEAAQHLVDEVGVQAILGAAYSGITIKFTTTVTIPKNVLVISPSATSVAITSLQDNNLVWRTSPSDVFQSTALASYMPILEAKVRSEIGLSPLPSPPAFPAEPIKVAILFKDDAYGKGLSEALESLLVFNNAAATDGANSMYYTRLSYGNPDDPGVSPTKYPEIVDKMTTDPSGPFLPHIVFALGTAEAVTDIMKGANKGIEFSWPTSPDPGYRPRYVFGDGGEVTDLIAAIGGDNALRLRVGGSVPGTKGTLFNQFILNYQSKYGNSPDPSVFGPAGSYDTIYLLAYAAASLANPDAPKALTGPNLAEGLKKLVPPGMGFPVGSSNINPAFNTLLTGNAIDFSGASGPLNFDTKTGEAPGDIQIWCVSGNSKFENSGIFYDAATSKLVDMFDPAKCN